MAENALSDTSPAADRDGLAVLGRCIGIAEAALELLPGLLRLHEDPAAVVAEAPSKGGPSAHALAQRAYRARRKLKAGQPASTGEAVH